MKRIVHIGIGTEQTWHSETLNDHPPSLNFAFTAVNVDSIPHFMLQTSPYRCNLREYPGRLFTCFFLLFNLCHKQNRDRTAGKFCADSKHCSYCPVVFPPRPFPMTGDLHTVYFQSFKAAGWRNHSKVLVRTIPNLELSLFS